MAPPFTSERCSLGSFGLTQMMCPHAAYHYGIIGLLGGVCTGGRAAGDLTVVQARDSKVELGCV